MLCDGMAELAGNGVQCFIPADSPSSNFRMQQAAFQTDGIPQSRAFGAKPAIVRRMVRVALDLHRAIGLGSRQHAAADPAIRAGGFGG